MKKGFVILWIAIFLGGCEDNSYDYGLDRYYVEIVTAIEENTFLLDNGETLYGVTGLKIKKDERILLHYTLLDEKTDGYDHTVRINGIGPVINGPLYTTSEEEIQYLVREPIRLQSIWLGSHFLNMQFYINYHSKPHSVAFFVDRVAVNDDLVEIHFQHDSHEDPTGFPSHLYASFDLKEVFGEPQQNKQIRIFVNTSNYGEKTYDFVY